MPSRLNYQVDRKYLAVSLTANGDTQYALLESRRIWHQVQYLCQREKRRCILATVSIEGPLPVERSVDIARLALESGLDKGVKIAFILPEDQNLLTFNLLATFLVYLGFQAATFQNKKRARKWLLSPDKKPVRSV